MELNNGSAQDHSGLKPAQGHLDAETHANQNGSINSAHQDLGSHQTGQALPKHQEGKDNEDLAQTQKDNQNTCPNKEKKELVILPVDQLPENKLFVLGTPKGRMLCEVRSVHIEPSQLSKDNQKNANEIEEEKGGQCPATTTTRYWQKRYFLFEKFDEGIQLDQQSWFSVTPQAVAAYITGRIGGKDKVVLDGFCGAGGDSIQFAIGCKKAIANDMDPEKLKLLQVNSAIYGIQNIMTSNSNFFDLKFKKGEIDVIYMSPPWGGPQYFKMASIRPQIMQPPLDSIIAKTFTMTDNIALLLPVNMNIEAMAESFAEALAPQHTSFCSMVVEKVYFLDRLMFLLVLVGKDAAKVNQEDELDCIYRMLEEGPSPCAHRAAVKRLGEKLGMVKLLSSLFECQNELWKDQVTLYAKLEAYLIHHDLIGKEDLQKISEAKE